MIGRRRAGLIPVQVGRSAATTRRHFLASKRLDRRLSAVLAADVAGYSRLVGADEEGTIGQLRDHRAALFDPKSPSIADAW